MAEANRFLIGANDEHGLNPPTAGKRTPNLPYINRSFFENEFNREAKNKFLQACLRCGFNVFDVKPEVQDISITTRLRRINNAGLTLLVNFAYNAFGTGTTFNSANGFEVFYSNLNVRFNDSRVLSEEVYEAILQDSIIRGLGVSTLNVSTLSSVNCPSTLIEAGFMTNFNEAKLMLDPDYVLAVAESSCKGVCNYLDVPYVARNTLNSYPTLRTGNRGNKVRFLQFLLNDYGYNLSRDGVSDHRPAAHHPCRPATMDGQQRAHLVSYLHWYDLALHLRLPSLHEQDTRPHANRNIQATGETSEDCLTGRLTLRLPQRQDRAATLGGTDQCRTSGLGAHCRRHHRQ